jgi:hypothetical protein
VSDMLTKEQAAIIGAYTGICCGPFSDIQDLAEKELGRPVFTHEFAMEETTEELREKVRPLFLAICHREQS